jgi:hypothetical protein
LWLIISQDAAIMLWASGGTKEAWWKHGSENLSWQLGSKEKQEGPWIQYPLQGHDSDDLTSFH